MHKSVSFLCVSVIPKKLTPPPHNPKTVPTALVNGSYAPETVLVCNMPEIGENGDDKDNVHIATHIFLSYLNDTVTVISYSTVFVLDAMLFPANYCHDARE